MNRQTITLIVSAVALALVCAGAGWFLVGALARKSEAESERNDDYQALQSIYNAKVFPNDENIGQVGKDTETLEQWLNSASNLIHTGDLQIANMTPASFKQTLQATVRRLSAHPGAIGGKIVPADFHFGFDQYLGQSDSLPTSDNVGRLAVQLELIEKICGELYAADILSLTKIRREVFDVAGFDSGEQQSAPTGRRRRRDREPEASSAAPAVVASLPKQTEFYSSQSFTFEFTARPAAFVAALNRLAKMEVFCAVSSVELSKSADSLADYSQKKSAIRPGDREKAEEIDLATLTHAQRLVTDPELEPPVNVKLDVDVYSFEGV